MDYVSRQFIVLAKKLRKDLRKSLDTIHSDIAQLIRVLAKPQVDATKAHNNTDTNPDQSQPRVVHAELSTPIAIAVKNEPQARHPNWQKAKTIAEIIGIAAAIVYAGIAVRQFREMVSARHMARDAIIAGKTSAREAMDQVQANFITDQRPYIWLTEEFGPFLREPHNPDNPLSDRLGWNFHFRNYGKSPAIKCQSIARIYFGKDAEQQITPKHLESTWGTILPPEKEAFNTAWSDGPINDLAFLTKMSTKGQVVHVVVSGHIQYSDTAGNIYDSEFCLQRTPSLNMVFCRTHNTIK